MKYGVVEPIEKHGMNAISEIQIVEMLQKKKWFGFFNKTLLEVKGELIR